MNKEEPEVHSIITFPFADEPKHILLSHGCAFVEGSDVWTMFFPEGTSREHLYQDSSQLLNTTAYYQIFLPDGLELREIVAPNETSVVGILFSNRPPINQGK
jgi:hypothetical protein